MPTTRVETHWVAGDNREVIPAGEPVEVVLDWQAHKAVESDQDLRYSIAGRLHREPGVWAVVVLRGRVRMIPRASMRN